jgi:hypothetical protein
MTTANPARTGEEHYRTPGVYFEEVAPAVVPGFPTGVPAFIGFVEATKDSKKRAPILLTRYPGHRAFWEQVGQRIGHAGDGRFLEYAVRGFFENGGSRCWVIPVSLPPSPDASALFQREGLLEDIEDIDLVCVPDVMLDVIRESPEVVLEIQRAVLEHCRRMGNRFAILDAFPIHVDGQGALDAAAIHGALKQAKALSAADGALYLPWIRVAALTGHSSVLVPPCGHVAGVYARTDTRVGIHKAPANEPLEGVLDLEVDVGNTIQGELNEAGVNCLRAFPRRGIRVWGARTLSPQPRWRYVNVRRVFLTLTRWLERNMSDLVMEPNEPSLWERIRHRIGAYCYELLQRGALQGPSPAEAFFVKCDAETNPPASREAGQVIAELGLATLVPTEFIIIRITLSVAGTTVTVPTGF